MAEPSRYLSPSKRTASALRDLTTHFNHSNLTAKC